MIRHWSGGQTTGKLVLDWLDLFEKGFDNPRSTRVCLDAWQLRGGEFYPTVASENTDYIQNT
jgi:hypothetical protein